MAGGDNVEIYDDVKIRLFKYFTSFLRDKIEMRYKQDVVGVGGLLSTVWKGAVCCQNKKRGCNSVFHCTLWRTMNDTEIIS